MQFKTIYLAAALGYFRYCTRCVACQGQCCAVGQPKSVYVRQ